LIARGSPAAWRFGRFALPQPDTLVRFSKTHRWPTIFSASAEVRQLAGHPLIAIYISGDLPALQFAIRQDILEELPRP